MYPEVVLQRLGPARLRLSSGPSRASPVRLLAKLQTWETVSASSGFKRLQAEDPFLFWLLFFSRQYLDNYDLPRLAEGTAATARTRAFAQQWNGRSTTSHSIAG
jgi:hypothetical protein